MLQVGWCQHSLKILALALMVWDQRCSKDLEEKDESLDEVIDEWVPEVFVEQPRIHPVC